jgi:hypothetical protein
MRPPFFPPLSSWNHGGPARENCFNESQRLRCATTLRTVLHYPHPSPRITGGDRKLNTFTAAHYSLLLAGLACIRRTRWRLPSNIINAYYRPFSRSNWKSNANVEINGSWWQEGGKRVDYNEKFDHNSYVHALFILLLESFIKLSVFYYSSDHRYWKRDTACDRDFKWYCFTFAIVL